MYEKLPNLVIGFHGCTKKTHEKVLTLHEELKASANSYDWLGNGIYFWENKLVRAQEWAKKRYGSEAAVIGATIDLGYCLNLTDSASEQELKNGYKMLKMLCELTGAELPVNRKSNKTKDVLLRDLDCAVIQQIQFGQENLDKSYEEINHNSPKYDSVRGVFTEGTPPYPGSAFYSKTHIQICVCNPNCIKGYFEPRNAMKNYRLP
ncbi:MAG: hypothetical protein IJT96_05790 [Lachnospiraceae bacterium]|nr:hypothetical protein [Lachnospiraceae bacterium]